MAEVNDLLTREEAMRVVNKAADLVIEEMWGGDATPEQDAINLLVNVFGAMLDNPDTTVDEVMDANYRRGAVQRRFGRGGDGSARISRLCKLQCKVLWGNH